MNVALGKKLLSAALCGPLVALTTPIDAGAAMAFQSPPAASASDYSGQGAPRPLPNYKDSSLPSHSIPMH